MGKRIYIETSVISYLVARPSPNFLTAAWQHLTHEWWDSQRSRFDLYTSELVLAEAGQGDPDAARKRRDALMGIPDLDVTDGVVALAKKLVGQLCPGKLWMMRCTLRWRPFTGWTIC